MNSFIQIVDGFIISKRFSVDIFYTVLPQLPLLGPMHVEVLVSRLAPVRGKKILVNNYSDKRFKMMPYHPPSEFSSSRFIKLVVLIMT